MDVTRSSFPAQLLPMLEAIAASHFVAIDCEFSGVANGIRPQNGRSKQTLAERYAQVRSAAERYQVLQVGITTAEVQGAGGVALHPEASTEEFLLRTWNVNLSPILDEDLGVERIFSFQSSAAEFLLRNNFSFDAPFRDGVPYLSRAEEESANAHVASRLDKSRFNDIQLTETDTEALQFLVKARGEIDEWLLLQKKPHKASSSSSASGGDSITISSRTRHWRDVAPGTADLTGFEKRLVHQLVRAEYPHLATFSKVNAISVVQHDADRDAKFRARQQERFTKKIGAHIGFRWVVEALISGTVSGIDVRMLEDAGGASDFYALARRLSRVQELLREKRPVLVGHNVMADIVYLYQSFVGELPLTVEGFREVLRRDFPLLVDTKYMATHNCGDINPMSSLEQIDEMLSAQQTPEIVLHPAFTKYNQEDAFHEAGFDSLLTARIMILLSAKLSSANTDSTAIGSSASAAPSKQAGSLLATSPTFTAILPVRPPPSPSRSPRRNRAASLARSPVRGTQQSKKPTALLTMPPFNAEFWTEYGNRLRAFGTFEGLFDLTDGHDATGNEDPHGSGAA